MDSQSENPQQVTSMTKQVIVKNVSVLCLGVVLLFTAYIGLAMVQSTLNSEQGVGVISQAVTYAGFCIASLLLPKYVITRLGSKRTLALSMLAYVPFIASNFYPRWVLMIPSAICIGIGAALLWGSQSNYLNDIAAMYASLSLKKEAVEGYCSADRQGNTDSTNTARDGNSVASEMYTISHTVPPSIDNSRIGLDLTPNKDDEGAKKILESTTALFFGFNGMAYLSSHVWTNLLTYFVLKRGVSEHYGNVTCNCGVNFCYGDSECFVSHVDSPSDSTRYLLSGICTGLGLLSILVVAFFLDPLETKRKEVRFSLELMAATCNIMKRKELILLLPYSFYLGQARGFYVGDITKSYIGCAWGAYHVGLVTVFYGVSSGLASSLSGWLVQRLGRLPVFSAAAVLNLAACVFLMLWSPDRRDTYMFFLAAILWGAPIGISWAQFKALYGILFKADQEAAFAAYHTLYSLGFCLSFSYSNYLCTYVKLYILMIVSTLGFIGYMLVERMQRKKC